MRSTLQLSLTEPINVKTVLRMLGVIALYGPLTDTLYGLSLKSADDKYRFMLINSNSTSGRKVLNLESLFGVSHVAMLIRLKELKLISNIIFEISGNKSYI